MEAFCNDCEEFVSDCTCKENKCVRCGEVVGNETFTVCDSCWETTSVLITEEALLKRVFQKFVLDMIEDVHYYQLPFNNYKLCVNFHAGKVESVEIEISHFEYIQVKASTIQDVDFYIDLIKNKFI